MIIDTGKPDTWPSNGKRAAVLLKQADDADWDYLDFRKANRLRAEAARLLKRPEAIEVPF